MITKLYHLKQFEEKLLDIVVELSKDKVVIVRIALAISVAEIIKKNPSSINLFKGVVQTLSQDVDDVKEYFL